MMRQDYQTAFYNAPVAAMRPFSFADQGMQKSAAATRSDDAQQPTYDAPVDVYNGKNPDGTGQALFYSFNWNDVRGC